MNIKIIRNLSLIVFLVTLSGIIGFGFGQKQTTGSGEKLDLSLMWRVKDRLAALYLDKDKMNDKEMTYGAIQGMVASLGDPYTVFLPPKENKSQNEDLAGEFGGVGIQLGYKDKTLAVMAPLPKTPAERANIKAGDLILKIIDKDNNIDRDTAGISLDEAVGLIRGKIGSQVTLKMFREGKAEAYDVTLTRENIVVPSIEMEWKESGGKRVAWVKLYKFSERIYQDWPKMVDEINMEKRKGNVAGVILDLRNNPGGYLQASVVVASDFINEGVIVQQASSDGSTETYTVDESRRKLLGDKLVVLVNGGSASAAEILAGALKEYSRGKLVGEKTFGKGTVQQPQDFSDGSGLHVTIAKWLLPSGKNIHKEGVEPDVEVKEDLTTETQNNTEKKDPQLDKAMELIIKG